MATKRPRAEEEKVWDAFQNCWTINGEPVDDANASDGEGNRISADYEVRDILLHFVDFSCIVSYRWCSAIFTTM